MCSEGVHVCHGGLGSGVFGVSRFEIHAGRRLDMFSLFGVVFDMYVEDMYF